MHVFGLTLVQIHVLISVIYFLSFHFLSTKQVLKIILVLLFNTSFLTRAFARMTYFYIDIEIFLNANV
jgi:hypothetical protein